MLLFEGGRRLLKKMEIILKNTMPSAMH